MNFSLAAFVSILKFANRLLGIFNTQWQKFQIRRHIENEEKANALDRLKIGVNARNSRRLRNADDSVLRETDGFRRD